LRAKECGAVRKCDVDTTCVVLAGQHTKNGKPAVVPLPEYAASALSSYCNGLEPDNLLWPGKWAVQKRAAKLLAQDAADCEPSITIGRKGHVGGVLDFHSFRHYYSSAVDRVGVSERLARRLVRVSTASLLDRYTHREAAELAAAVAGFPSLQFGACGDMVVDSLVSY